MIEKVLELAKKGHWGILKNSPQMIDAAIEELHDLRNSAQSSQPSTRTQLATAMAQALLKKKEGK